MLIYMHAAPCPLLGIKPVSYTHLGDLILALHGNRDNMSMRDRRMYQNTSCFDMRHNRHKIKCLMRRRLVDFQCVGQSAMIITRVSYTANDGCLLYTSGGDTVSSATKFIKRTIAPPAVQT